MAGDKVNNYSQVDSNILELQLTTDKTFKGYHQLTLTEYDTTTVPAIAAGSAIECNGALYKFDTEEAISTTDPVTSSTVADGTVYVCIVPGATTCTAAFTATTPTWSDSKQGWYGTGGQANYRYAGGALKSSSNYYIKFIYNRFNKEYFSSYTYTASDATQRTTTSVTEVKEDNLSITFSAIPGQWYNIFLCGEFWSSNITYPALVNTKITSGNGTFYDISTGLIEVARTTHVFHGINKRYYSGAGGDVTFDMYWRVASGTAYCEDRVFTAKLDMQLI